MAKQKTIYSCTECGGQTLKWQGQCPHCQSWNTLIETIAEKSVSRFSPVSEIGQVQNLSTIEAREEPRYPTGVDELDRVLGGGLVQGGVVLLGGDPGIGKSTLLLQALSHLSTHFSVHYLVFFNIYVFCFSLRMVLSAVFSYSTFFFNDTATTEIYTRSLVGSVRCV